MTALQRLSDFSLRRYLMHNVTCFVLQLAHLLARWEDKAFWIRLKRFVFFSTFQLACLFPDRGAPLLHNVPVQWVGRRGAVVDNDASGRNKVGISGPTAEARRVDESCHMLTTRPYHCVSKLAPAPKKKKKLTQIHERVQSQNSLLYFPHWQVPYML